MALENLTPATRLESILNGDDIAPVTREEYFLRKAASGSGEGGLPPYTSADKGKVLTVGEDAEHGETTVIIPVQEITLVDEPVPVNGSLDALNNGDSCTITVNGVSHPASCEVTADGKEIITQDGTIDIFEDDGTLYAVIGDPIISGSYTISASIITPATVDKWDAPVLVYYPSNTYNFIGISVSEALEMLGKVHKLPFTVASDGVKICSHIVQTGADSYSVFMNFSSTAVAQNVRGSVALPHSSGL